MTLKFEYHRIGRLADVAVEFHHDNGTVYVAGILRFTRDGLREFLDLISAQENQAEILYVGEIPSDAVGLALARPAEGGQA